MARRRNRTAAAAAALTVAAAWGATYAGDRRRIAADPCAEALAREVGGRPVSVAAGDGTALRVRVLGNEDAPTVVFIHGWTCALEFWKLELQALAGELRLVAYDLRGHGGSAPSGGGDYSIDAFSDDLDRVLRATVPDGEKAILIGHSLGAMTIVAWASDHADEVTERVSAVGLFSTGVGDLISSSLILPAPKVGQRIQQEIGQIFLGASVPLPKRTTPVSARVVRYVALCGSATPATVAFCEQMVLRCPRDVRANTGSTVSRLDLYEGLAAIDVPTIVLVGRNDRLTPPVHAERMAERLPQLLDLIELPEVGHMAPVESPERTIDAIRRLAAAAAADEQAAGRGVAASGV